MKSMLVARKWARYYNGGWYGKSDLDLYYALPQLSPEYTKAEIEQMSVGDLWVARRMMSQSNQFNFPYTLEVPGRFLVTLVNEILLLLGK